MVSTDVILEGIRAIVLLILVGYLWSLGNRKNFIVTAGWRSIQFGFVLILFGSFLDVTDNFDSLNRYVVVGDTETEAFLEKVVGYLAGFVLLTFGLIRWGPTVEQLMGEIRDREKAERGSAESEERFRGLVEGSIQGIIIHRDHKPLFVNRMWAEIHGFGIDEIRTDPSRSTRALLNLLSNAVKFNCEGGTVWLDATHPDQRTLRISVTDTGPGIPEDRHSDLFQPFSRPEAAGTKTGGTGIGLVLTKRLMEKMDGAVGFSSTPGEGSTFWIDFPIADRS